MLAKSNTYLGVRGANRGATLSAGWGGMWMQSTGGTPANVVGATHPKETVIFNWGYSTSGSSIDSKPYPIPNRSLVEGMSSLPANSVLDRVGNALYRARYGSKWIGEWACATTLSSSPCPASWSTRPPAGRFTRSRWAGWLLARRPPMVDTQQTGDRAIGPRCHRCIGGTR
ncbi:hypothetical protein MSAR_12700 [Mycolicibacterium sarraceniae]|uniref:Uncharacterized protein n=1 Tax=Mycolicibacterium sarraceniae TaxID=1534348 RepID=A0A7I7SMC4_9MYCO|nr:hypothetical protein MSAR_12700 [Mycolicibacterium sarraceniae]